MIFLVIASLSIIVVWLINKFFKTKWLKYIFVLLLLILTIYFILISRNGNREGFEDLGNFILALFSFTAMISSLITAIILDLIKKKSMK